jgi:phage/plasmid-associated DNA primase
LNLVLGHILLGDTTFKICYLFRGIAGGGKSSAVKVIKALVGKDFTCSVDLSNFSNAKFNYPLFFNRLNAIEEHPNIRLSAEATNSFKKCIMFEVQQYKKLYEDPADANFSVINVIASNHPIMFAEQSQAISDRMRILKFNTPIRGTGKEIPDIESKILADAPNLIHVILDSYLNFKSDNPSKFPESNYHQDELREQQENACHVARFCNEKFTKGEIGVNYYKPSTAYDDYKNWCSDEGISKPFTKRELIRRAEEILCIETRQTKVNGFNIRAWHGITKKHIQLNIDDFKSDNF